MSDYIHPDSIEYKLNLGRVPPEPQEGIIWRGMSGGEYKNLLEQGFLESKGDYNIGESQKGLTIFSSNPRTAEMYAHDFAPREFKATPESSAYVVGIRKPSGAIPQTQINPSEFGVRGQIPIEDILSVYRGNVFRPRSDRQRAVLDWQEMSLPERRLPHDEPRSTALTQIFRTGDPSKGEEPSIGEVANQIDKLVGRVRTSLTPNQFRQLASHTKLRPNTFLEESLRNQDAVAPPWLKLHWDPEKSAWKVIGHEGRNRSAAARNVFGDRAIPVDFFLRADHRGATGLRIEQDELTPEMKQALEDRRFISQEGVQVREYPELTEEPRSTDLAEYAPIPEPVNLSSTDLVEQRPGLPRLTGIGQAFRGIGSMIGGPKLRAVRKLITMAQQGYELLPEEQKLLGDVLDMEALTKPIPGTGRGLEYFRQLLGMKPRSLEEAYPDLREKLGLYEDEQGGITSLPMDEASRMARAGEQKFDIDSYHGTRDDFTIFEKGDLGYHFGTPEQAWKRLVDTRETADWEPHNAEENIMPVRLRLKNPLELPDVGSWQLPEVIARRALETKWGKSHSNELNEIMDEAAELAPTFADLDDWADSPEASELMDELRDMIKKDGYDGIKYRNIVESKYGKEGGGLTVEGHKQYEALNKEWHELRRAIFIRNEQAKRPLPHPSEATPEKVQEWLNRGLDTTPEERARLEQIAKLKELVRKNESYDPHSYIVFDSKNIRSRFAEFDPAQSESPEISKAAGGFIDKPLYGRA